MTASICINERWIQARRSISGVERSRHHTRNCRLHQVRHEPGGRARTSEISLFFQNNHLFVSHYTSPFTSCQISTQSERQLSVLWELQSTIEPNTNFRVDTVVVDRNQRIRWSSRGWITNHISACSARDVDQCILPAHGSMPGNSFTSSQTQRMIATRT